MLRIAIGSDHRGKTIKERLVRLLKQQGHEVIDVGTHNSESVDYPDYAERVGAKVVCGEADRGILICGTGTGMAIAANKLPGIRAAAVYDEVTAEMSRRHNNINVLCLPANLLSESQLEKLVDIFLKTQFEGGRHERRLRKIERIEQHQPDCS